VLSFRLFVLALIAFTASMWFASSRDGQKMMAQVPAAVEQADPTADVQQPILESGVHKPLPEQFIWLAMPPGTPDKTDEAAPRYFRTSFELEEVPRQATLYISGPDQVHAFVNGKLVASADRDPKSKTYPLVVVSNVSYELRRGKNEIAIEGRGGSPLAVKIVPAAEEVDAPAVLISGIGWKASLREQPGWQRPGFDDSAWQAPKALGSIDTRVDGYRRWYVVTSNLEWNSDSEMYRWPGYDGISPYLAHLPITALSVSDVAEGAGHFENIDALTKANLSAEFEVKRPEMNGLSAGGPVGPTSLVLDFGRETNGRLQVTSDSAEPMRISLQYGESREEALKEPYLGVNELLVPPHATVFGPKSAFRYVKLSFPSSVPFTSAPLRFKSIRLDAIYYPVRYLGSFESSDALLNRIWAVGAYTAHLCMQDAIWDAPKRDRMPWMGDLDVSGDVIDTAFADRFLMQNTMDRLINEAGNPLTRDVNGIPGYSAFWVMGEADYYRHIGDKGYLRSLHDRLIQLLDYMTGELNDQKYFANTRKAWPFVDWSPEMEKDTPEARSATQFEFYKAFSEGAWLLSEMGDSAAAQKYKAEGSALQSAAQNTALDPGTYTFGDRWQPNAMAIYSGVANPKETEAIWDRVLSHPPKFMISPYYNFYAITAMAEAGHRREALDWIRRYWGGMIDEGATSFWEGYDPSWPKKDFHAHLNADDEEGYRTSLAHGWSSGPTVWLSEQILGIQPTAAGFREVTIRPDLAGLNWARGSVPTPQGPISVDYKAGGGLDAQIDVPAGVTARVSMPVCAGQSAITVVGGRVSSESAESGHRVVVRIDRPGHYELRSNCTDASSE
jgi:alpha-L-rhamnosidase